MPEPFVKTALEHTFWKAERFLNINPYGEFPAAQEESSLPLSDSNAAT